MKFTLLHHYLKLELFCLAFFKLSSSIKVALDEFILFFLFNPQKKHTKPVAIIHTIRNIVPTPTVTANIAKTIFSIVAVTVLAIVVVIVFAIVGSVKLARVDKTINKVKANNKLYY